MKKSLILCIILVLAIKIIPAQNYNNRKSIKIGFANFINKTPHFNKWLSYGISQALTQRFRMFPIYKCIDKGNFNWKLRKLRFSVTITKKNVARACKRLKLDYIVYGNISSNKSYKKEGCNILSNIFIGSKNNSKILSFKTSETFKNISNLITKIAISVNNKVGNTNINLHLKVPFYGNSKAFVHLISGINNFNKRKYCDAIERCEKAIKSNNRYIDLAVRFIMKSYINLLTKIKKSRRPIYRYKKTSNGRKEKIKLSFNQIKARLYKKMWHYARIATPALFYVGATYYYRKNYSYALSIWKRLAEIMNYGGSALNWKKNLTGRIATAGADSNHVYVGSTNGHFYCLNRKNGKKVWTFNCMSPIQVAPNINKNKVYVMSGGYPSNLATLHGFNAMTGNNVFNHMIPGDPTGTPLLVNNTVIAGTATGSGNLIAVNKTTGQIIWRRRSFFPRSYASDKNNVYVISRRFTNGSNNIKYLETVVCINPKTGKAKWNFNAVRGSLNPDHNPSNARISVNKNKVYAVFENALVILKKSNGSLIKKYNFPAPLRYVYNKNNIVYIGMNDKVNAFDPIQGKVLFTFNSNGVVAYPVVKNNIIHFGTSDRFVYALDAKTGKYFFLFVTYGEIYCAPALYKRDLFISSYDGFIYSVRGGRDIFKIGVHKSELYYYMGMALLKLRRINEASRYFRMM